MKRVLLIIAILLTGCDKSKETPVKYSTIEKTVKAKNQGEETDYGYHYDWLNGKFRQHPEIHSAYYIIYTDGTFDKVDVGRFATINIGDKVYKKVIINK